jgi:nicotinamide mononucleotide transporter
LEMLGALSGAWCVWLTVDENLWTWPVGIVSSLLFAVLFWHQRLFGASGMQIAYVGFSMIGWYCWLHGGARHERLSIGRVPAPSALWLAGLGLALLPVLMLFLSHWHDASPMPDACALALSLVAQYLVTKKYVEHWSVSIAADVVYISLYLSHGLFLTGSLYLMHGASCACGLWQWRRSLEDRSATASSQTALLV